MTATAEEEKDNEDVYDQDAMLEQLKEMIDSMPPGWTRNKQGGDGSAPYVHEDGHVSWKHPRRQQMDAFIQEMRAKYQTAETAPTLNNSVDRSMLKRLRMMLKSGVPLKAVEQRALVEGIDPVLILEDDETTPRSNDTVALKESSEKRVHHHPNQEGRVLKKFRMMIKAGVPMKAVQQLADVEGVDISILTNACTTSTTANASSSNKTDTNNKESDHAHSKNMEICSDNNDDSNNKIFVANLEKRQVTFTNGSDLTRLVTKLVQTVSKRAKASTDLTIDMQVLYHALGSLKGVQHSRNVYNSTTTEYTPGKKMPLMEARSKRKPFLELMSSLGMTAPTEFGDTVDIAGLDALVRFIEDTFMGELETIQSLVNVGMYEFDSLGELYKPGSRVIAKNAFAGGVGMMCEVVWNRYEQGRTLFGVSKTFKVCFQFVVAVGTHFTLAECVEGIESFDGKRSVQSLSFVPFAAYTVDDIDKLTAMYAERGRVYNKVSKTNTFMAYEKGSFFAKRTGGGKVGVESSLLHSGGRVMVDIQGGYEAGHSIGTGYESMVMGIKYKYKEYMLHMRTQKGDQASTRAGSALPHSSDMVLFDQVPEDYLPMTWPAVVGFSFQNKVWGDVLVDGLTVGHGTVRNFLACPVLTYCCLSVCWTPAAGHRFPGRYF